MTTHFKAVFFDLDGTLRIPSPSPTEAFIQFARSQQIDIDEEAARRVKIWAHRFWGQDDLLKNEWDRLGEEAFWINYSRRLLETVEATGNLQVQSQQVRDYFGSSYVPQVELAAGAAELLAELKSAGYILGVISNRLRPFHDVLAQLGITDCFNMTLAAGEIGVWKPNPAIFDHVRSCFPALEAAECLYVGDNYFADGVGASEAGMMPIIYDPEVLYDDLPFTRVHELRQITAVLTSQTQH